MSSVNLKPNNQKLYDRSRDFLAVNICLYTVEGYLILTQLSSPTIQITDMNMIAFASFYLKGHPAVWWFNIFNSPEIPTARETFKNLLTAAFLRIYHTQRAPDKLRKLRQVSSVEKYLSEYRNKVMTIGDINDGKS